MTSGYTGRLTNRASQNAENDGNANTDGLTEVAPLANTSENRMPETTGTASDVNVSSNSKVDYEPVGIITEDECEWGDDILPEWLVHAFRWIHVHDMAEETYQILASPIFKGRTQ